MQLCEILKVIFLGASRKFLFRVLREIYGKKAVKSARILDFPKSCLSYIIP